MHIQKADLLKIFEFKPHSQSTIFIFSGLEPRMTLFGGLDPLKYQFLVLFDDIFTLIHTVSYMAILISQSISSSTSQVLNGFVDY